MSPKKMLPFIALLFLLTPSSQAQEKEVEIKIEQLSPSIYMLIGQGGNIGVSVGDDGVFMIDSQFAKLSAKIREAISTITTQPYRYLINTHWHGDHTGGNENFNTEGALIVAHENVRKRMSTEQLMEAFGRTVPPSPQGAWPKITFEEDLNLFLNGEDIFLFHVHNAHTDGDVIIYFPKSNIVHMGDTYFQGKYPFIDLSSGGSIDGIIKAANQVLFLIDDKTKIIPGHGPMSNKKELTEYRDVLMTIRDRVKQAVTSGKTLEEINAAGLSKEFDEQWGQGFIKPEYLIDFIYTDLTRGEKE